jgi:hypothetical protein
MSIVNTSNILLQPRSTSKTLIENDDDDSQEHVIFLQELNIKPRHHMNNTSSPSSISDRIPSNLLELKQQRLLAAADRKKRIITRIISVVGLLIILLCAIIVTLTLKMAPKIDELVRTKTGTHQSVHFRSRMTTLLTTRIIELNNSYSTKFIYLIQLLFITNFNTDKEI